MNQSPQKNASDPARTAPHTGASPGGGIGEKLMRAVATAKRVARDEGVARAAKLAVGKIGRKLGVIPPRPVPHAQATEQTSSESLTPSASPHRIGDRVIQSAAISEEYTRALNVADSSAQKTLPTYVPFDPTEYDYSNSPAKVVAFYLPQFYPFPENDKWWGKGFTEWTNVSKAIPQFVGHYQPHLPDELGFYDLRVNEVQERQVELAKHYGLSGFCFYYYWFDGRRLLDKPLDSFVENPNINFPFCLMWANEDWTRRWDGMEGEILMGQTHSPESDVRFIEDTIKYLKHPNYMKIDGRPILMIYRHTLLPNVTETLSRWRETCKAHGVADPYIMVAESFGYREDPRPLGFDAAIQFPPHNLHKECVCLHCEGHETLTTLHNDFRGMVYSYPSIVGNLLFKPRPALPYPVYETAVPMWDNTARRAKSGHAYAYGSPELYRLWLQQLLQRSTKNKYQPEHFVFVNAWNEWAEGAHLEPDRRYGYGYLQATRDALLNVTNLQNCDLGKYKNIQPHDYDKEALAKPPKSPIIIFQMGKVASGTAHVVLSELKLSEPVLHCHMLAHLEQIEERLISIVGDPTTSLEHIAVCKKIRDWMATADDKTVWNVITLVREPVGRNVSEFFERANQFLPNLRERIAINDITIEEVRDVFLHAYRQEGSLDWFNNQFKTVFDIDVLNEPFDPAKGYAIYEKLPTRVLLIRVKDLNGKLEQALEDFLGIKGAKPIQTNTAEDKDYIDLIQRFRKMPLPHEYVSKMLSSKLATHFFSPEELADLYRRYTEEGLQ